MKSMCRAWCAVMAMAVLLGVGQVRAEEPTKAELDEIRQALEKYKDPYVAVRDLYLSTVGCVHYDGRKMDGHMHYEKGAMGIHFVNLTVTGPLDPKSTSGGCHAQT